LALSASAASTLASSRSVNLAELTASSGRIVHGRIAEVRAGRHPTYSHLEVTFVTLEVIEMLKGTPARRVTFMQYGNSQGGIRSFHLPRYTVGEEVVLFLYPESRSGFTSPVGEGQGKFLVRHDPLLGRRALLNERGNRALFERLDLTKMPSRLTLDQAEREVLAQERGAAEFESFRSLVRKLAVSQRGTK
jgi:hypothetical protein